MQLKKGEEPYPGYRLVQFLGRGGWGEVWKAIRLADEACFALKFLPSDSQIASSQEIRGLQGIRLLNHPNLVRIEQVWSCPGYLVIVMEMAEGNLLDLLDVYYAEFNVPILPDHLCFFLSQTAQALDFLNSRQHIVDGQRVAFRHCDVKPSNMLVQGRTVKLADFSLAVQTTSPLGNHPRAGTVNYSGPELFQGLLSDRSDQYALAVSYFQLRTGRFPFPDSPASFDSSYVRSPPDLESLTPPERTILARALDTVPQNRWPSCVEMMNRLTKAIAPRKSGLLPVARI
jgi:serine/threonine protein kinase, bacterial